MQTSLLEHFWPSSVARKPLLRPVLIALAALFLFCLPLNQIPLSFSGIQHPAVAFSLLLSIVMVCIGAFEIARQKRISTTPLTGWLAAAMGIALLPAFYQHAEPSAALWHGVLLPLAWLLFVTLQQFSFNHKQRQTLLWLPVLAGWLLAIPLLLPALLTEPHRLFSLLTASQETAAIVLLTALAFSAYLLARTKVYKRNWQPVHITLMMTPLLSIAALMSMSLPWLLTPVLVIVLFAQPFLLRFCAKRHHALWNIAALAGFVVAFYQDWLPHAALFSSPFSAQSQSLLNQTWALTETVPFAGVGLGHLPQAQLLFGWSQGMPLPVQETPPSWLLSTLAQGGIAVWMGFSLMLYLTIRRLLDAPSGTRLMLTAMVLPSLLGMALSGYLTLNPTIGLLFVVLLYWTDNLTARYQRVPLQRTGWLKKTATAVIIVSSLMVVSSVYLGEIALRPHQVSGHKLTQYRLHPWWADFYQQEADKRAFAQSLESNDQQGQDAYLRQQIQRLADKPTLKGYQSVITLARQTGHDEIAKQLREEAQSLFPESNQLNSALR